MTNQLNNLEILSKLLNKAFCLSLFYIKFYLQDQGHTKQKINATR